MALGDYSRNTDNNKKNYSQPILRLDNQGTMNPDGIDPSALNYEFYNGMLKIIIIPLKFGTDPNKKFTYDQDNRVEMWLTPTKAKIFYEEIKHLLANRDTINNVGVCTTKGGLIVFSTGKEFGVDSECLVIRKIDNDGTITSTYAYQFKPNPNNFGIRNFNQDSPADYDRIAYSNTEVDQLLAILKEFSEAMVGAYAYANMYYGRFDYNRLLGKVNSIMDKLGIEKSSEYSRSNNNGGGSYFSNNQGNNAGEGYSNNTTTRYDNYNMMDDAYND